MAWVLFLPCTIYNLVSLAAVFSVVTQWSSHGEFVVGSWTFCKGISSFPPSTKTSNSKFQSNHNRQSAQKLGWCDFLSKYYNIFSLFIYYTGRMLANEHRLHSIDHVQHIQCSPASVLIMREDSRDLTVGFQSIKVHFTWSTPKMCQNFKAHLSFSEHQISMLMTEIGPLHDLVTWYGINYAGMQIMQWDFQKKGKLGWSGKSSFNLEVPLYYLHLSIIYSIPCDWILQSAYRVPKCEVTKK